MPRKRSCVPFVSRLGYCNSLLAGSAKYLSGNLGKFNTTQTGQSSGHQNLTKLPHFCMHFTGFQSISESTTNSLPSAPLLSLALVLNTLPTFSRFKFLSDSFVPPQTLVCFRSLLSMQSHLASVLLHSKALQFGTNSRTTSGMPLLSILSKLL